MSKQRRKQEPKKRKGPPWTLCTKTGKRGYKSKLNALTVASWTSKRGGLSRPYKCPTCGNWHLTSWATPSGKT